MLAFAVNCSRGQETSGKSVSYGVILGDPLGIALQYRTGGSNAIDVNFGPDYFGSPRLQMDYLWRFDTFHTASIRSYVGPGLAVAFAKGSNMFFSHEPHHEIFADQEDKHFAVGGRAIFGLDIAPRASRFEYFVEVGPMIPMIKTFDLDLDGAIGARVHL